MDPGGSHGGGSRRRNGWEWPFHWFQVASWVLLAFFPIMFGVFTAPFLRLPHSAIWVPVYCVGGIATVVLEILATSSDPTDPGVADPLPLERLQDEAPAEHTACAYCQAFVHESSKHCRTCNKCVVGFDHHCKWLNNCVGSRNYKLFLTFVVVTLLTLVLQTALIVYQFVDSFYDNWYHGRAASLYSMALWVWQVIIGIVGGMALVADGLLLQLCGFHAWLAIQGLSTYDWIVRRREERRLRRRGRPAGRVSAELQPCDLSATPTHGSPTPAPKAPSLPPGSKDVTRSNTPTVTTGVPAEPPHGYYARKTPDAPVEGVLFTTPRDDVAAAAAAQASPAPSPRYYADAQHWCQAPTPVRRAMADLDAFQGPGTGRMYPNAALLTPSRGAYGG